MAAYQTKFILIGWLCLSVLLFTWGCVLPSTVTGDNSLMAVRSLRVEIEESQREELFTQFQKFAEENDFKIEISSCR